MPSVYWRAAALLPVLVLAGCASYRPQPLDPSAELTALERRDLAVLIDDKSLPLGPLNLADGLDERELVSVALRLNPDLAEQRAGLGISEAALIEAGLWPNPELGLRALAGGPGFAFDLDLLQPLLHPGVAKAKRSAAEAGQHIALADLAATEWSTVSAIRTARVDLLAALALQGAATESQAIASRAAQAVAKQRELGEVTELDLSQAQWEQAEASSALRQAQAAATQAQLQITRLLGLPPHALLVISDAHQPLAWQPPVALSDADLAAAVLDNRWELTAAQARYAKADAALHLALARQYPALHLGPALSHDDSGTGFGLGASLELPIFDRNQGGIKTAEIERDQALAAYRALLHRLCANAAAAQADVLRHLADVQQMDRELLPAAARTMQLADQGLAARELSLSAWLALRRHWLDVQRSRLDAIAAGVRASITLDAALGRAPHAPPQPKTNRTVSGASTP